MQTATTNAKQGNPSWKRNSGDDVHPSGTIVHWDDRDPADPYWQIGITCHHCQQPSYTHKQNVNNPAWHGFCPKCVDIPGLFRKLKGKEKLASGGVVDWDDRDPNDSRRRRVACPNFARCGNKEFKRIDAGNKNSQPFYCHLCFIEDKRSRMKRAWDAGSGKGGNNGPGKAEREADKAIEVVWGRVRSLNLPFEKRLKLVTGIVVAAEYRPCLGESGSANSFDQLRKKLSREGVAAKFPGIKQWFPAYVKSVVERIEATGQSLSSSTGR